MYRNWRFIYMFAPTCKAFARLFSISPAPPQLLHFALLADQIRLRPLRFGQSGRSHARYAALTSDPSLSVGCGLMDFNFFSMRDRARRLS
jgi:hypothetical protein